MGERSTLESGASGSQPESAYVPPSSCSAVSLSLISTQKISPVKFDSVVQKSPRAKRKSRHPSVSSAVRNQEEQDGVQDLLKHIPEIREEFDILSKIGEGTFSSVYLACLKGYPEEKFAVKHLVPTSSSSRIENELKFLQLLGGKDNVIPILTCLRHRDHIALIMPYFQHDRFADYLPLLSLSEARDYMRALFVALRNIHSHHIIHRDIKPSNFLYNRATKQFQLVDFGLAHPEPKYQSTDQEKGGPTRARTRSKTSSDCRMVTGLNGIVVPPSQTYQRQVHHRTAARAFRQSTSLKSRPTPSGAGGGGAVHGRQNGGSRKSGDSKQPGDEIRACPLRHGVNEVCDSCLARGNQTAPRAGTPGFRAPEVLLKCPSQTTAVDMWSAGVILLCILSGRYPFFRAHNDLSALAQIIGLMGTRECIEAANTYGKTLVCEPAVDPTNLRELCTTLRLSLCDSEDDLQPGPSKKSRLCNGDVIKSIQKSLSPRTRKSPRKSSQDSSRTKSNTTNVPQSANYSTNTCKSECSSDSWNQVPESAFDLLHRCLDLNPATRITAEQALYHSFVNVDDPS